MLGEDKLLKRGLLCAYLYLVFDGFVKIKEMNKGKKFNFLKPRLINLILTLVVLCLPILREQYNNGEYVTYYRPIVVMIDYFQRPQQPHLLLIMAIFILVVYFVVSLAIVGILKFLFLLFRHWKTNSFMEQKTHT